MFGKAIEKGIARRFLHAAGLLPEGYVRALLAQQRGDLLQVIEAAEEGRSCRAARGTDGQSVRPRRPARPVGADNGSRHARPADAQLPAFERRLDIDPGTAGGQAQHVGVEPARAQRGGEQHTGTRLRRAGSQKGAGTTLRTQRIERRALLRAVAGNRLMSNSECSPNSSATRQKCMASK